MAHHPILGLKISGKLGGMGYRRSVSHLSTDFRFLKIINETVSWIVAVKRANGTVPLVQMTNLMIEDKHQADHEHEFGCFKNINMLRRCNRTVHVILAGRNSRKSCELESHRVQTIKQSIAQRNDMLFDSFQ